MVKNVFLSDEELLNALHVKGSGAFDEVFERFYPALFQLAYQLLDNEAEAQDVTSDTFIKCWKSGIRFRFIGELVNWLQRTARNAALDILKHRSIQDKKKIEILEATYNKDVYIDDDIYAELLREIYHQIEQLPPKSREIFKLRYIEGLKNEAIAELLGIQHQTVRDHVARSLKALRMVMLSNHKLLPIFLIFITTK